jgi:CRP-like cAMP-binding protein
VYQGQVVNKSSDRIIGL